MNTMNKKSTLIFYITCVSLYMRCIEAVLIFKVILCELPKYLIQNHQTYYVLIKKYVNLSENIVDDFWTKSERSRRHTKFMTGMIYSGNAG